MEFRIADTFTSSLAKLPGEEQKAVKTTAFDLQINPSNPGMSFHKLDHARDPRFWSVRVSSDLRLIVHRTDTSLLLCYVDHHDQAYRWAERRKLETHPKTGAAQLVEIRETVQEITIPRLVEVVQTRAPNPPLFAQMADEDLLGFGIPAEWIPDVKVVDEDGLLELADHLPAEAAEALLEIATGGKPKVVVPSPALEDPFQHPDALRRFRVMANVEELAQALEYPWEKWTIFLHPAQRQWVERTYTGPARVSGSAGTGKTIVALHRAVFLARSHPECRVLLTTFSETLANALRTKLRCLISREPQLGERLEVHALSAIGIRLFEATYGKSNLATPEVIGKALLAANQRLEGSPFTLSFLVSEWNDIVDAWQIETWDEYRDAKRLGRKTRLPEAQRERLWAVFEDVRSHLKAQGLTTQASLFKSLTLDFANRKHMPFDFAVVDEAQDIGVAQLRFLSAMGSRNPQALFFAGDMGQRIFQQPFSWKALGVDIRGRSRNLNINYRTSHQIRMQADRLLGPEVSDVDGNTETRKGTVSVFNGPAPMIKTHPDPEVEIVTVAQWLKDRTVEGVQPHEIGIFVRSEDEVGRAQEATSRAGLAHKVLDDQVETIHDQVAISTMHLAKGLEFRAVVVMACDDEVIPCQSRIETASDDSELEEIYTTERHLLYVACTRARDHLLLTSGGPGSEFLDDLIRN
jgi:superfamily I DNA/RNA helicase/mRNA-degrading endonuclease RelE of RelBE toxin-antitoxin system